MWKKIVKMLGVSVSFGFPVASQASTDVTAETYLGSAETSVSREAMKNLTRQESRTIDLLFMSSIAEKAN